MKRNLTILSCLLILWGQSLLAQTTLEGCVDAARKHYPLIAQYDLVSKSTEYSLANAAKAWLPRVSVSAQTTWQNRVPEFPEAMTNAYSAMGLDFQGLDKWQYKIGVDVQQTLWDGGWSAAERRSALLKEREEMLSADKDFYALEKRVSDIYFGILLLRRQMELADVSRSILAGHLETVRSCVSLGTALASDADALEAELLSATQRIEELKASESAYARMLSLLTGTEIDPELLQTPSISGETRQVRPEFALFDASSRRLEADRMLLNSSLHPSLSLFAQGYYGYPGLNMFDDMISRTGSFNAIVGLRLTWNISAFYDYKGKRNQLDLAQRKIELQKDIFSFNNTLSAQQEDASISRLRTLTETDARITRLRNNVRKSAEAKYKEGTIQTLDLLKAISDEQSAALSEAIHEIQLIQAIHDYNYTIQ